MKYEFCINESCIKYLERDFKDIKILKTFPDNVVKIELDINYGFQLSNIFHCGAIYGIDKSYQNRNKNVFNEQSGIY